VAAAGLSDRPWEIVVFNNDAANAFVLPGGQIGVNTGLLTIVENDDQLAAVIGHKIAHMTANHSAERYSQTAATQVVLAGAQTALGGSASRSAQAVGALGGAGAQLGVLLPFSRRHELEADRIGVDYMVRAGYRADQSVRLWTNMTAGRGGGATGGFLSTHPSDQQRIAALQAHITARGYR
jgi:predicted Zn-dependent protease